MKKQYTLEELENMTELDISGLSPQAQYAMFQLYDLLMAQQEMEDKLAESQSKKEQ